ncbi:MAG: citrate/2-methylcitrate synthase [Candidatus Dormibacteria bacterium]
MESRLASVTTGITQIRQDGASYRGRPIAPLATSATFEEVADLLWRADAAPTDWEPVRLPRPPRLDTGDLLRWVTVMCGARDRLRADLRAELVIRSARRLISTMVAALPATSADAGAPSRGSTAEGLARHLVPSGVSPAMRRELDRTLDVALVLLADHELATSTVAVRVAASTRADLYDAVLAGLGTLAGPLHGGASQLAYTSGWRARIGRPTPYDPLRLRPTRVDSLGCV